MRLKLKQILERKSVLPKWWGKPLKTIQHYFKVNYTTESNQPCELPSNCETSVQMPLLLGIPENIISATKVSILLPVLMTLEGNL